MRKTLRGLSDRRTKLCFISPMWKKTNSTYISIFLLLSTNVEAAAKLRPGSKSNKLSFQFPCHSSNNFSSADGMRELINHRVKNSDRGNNWEEKLGTLFARAEALKQ